MKASYLALFGMVFAYSAYQGTGTSDQVRRPPKAELSGDSAAVNKSGNLRISPIEVEPLPAISAGVCSLVVRGNLKAACGNCTALCPAEQLTELIDDYFRPQLARDEEYWAGHWHVPQVAQPKLKFLIASLPDPVHTHMALLFDRGIESIQSAAQASGYLFSRAWMPWDISQHNESTDFTVRMAQEKFRNEVESLPGLMIFQKSTLNGEIAPEILFVFVVGETPTGGLRVEQFQNALDIRESILDGATPQKESGILRVFGPEFSGSLLSLDAVLRARHRDQVSKILIRSGTISSYSSVHNFREAIRRNWSDPNATSRLAGLRKPSEELDFATFQFSDTYEEYYLARYFQSRDHLHSRVAILSEDETAFGNQESLPNNKPKDSFVRLYFPREIAQLRDAYQQNVKIQQAAGSGKNPPQNGLALSLSVTGNDDDTVAPYSPLQSPLSQESIMQAIVDTLRREHAKVVIIRATDPLDVIFLSRYLRQNYPQARLITAGADLLMIHDFYDPQFHGILAVTPYPLLTAAQFPTLSRSSDDGGLGVQRLFPDSYSVGQFNALLSLLAPSAESEMGKLPKAEYINFGLPSFLQPAVDHTDPTPWRAHLWLTAIGRNGYWPVSVLDDPSRPADLGGNSPPSSIRAVEVRPSPASTYSVHFSLAWTIFWILTCGLTFLLAVLLVVPYSSARSEILERFRADRSSPRNRLLFLASLLLLASQTIFMFPAIVWFGRFGKFAEDLTFWDRVVEALNGMWLVVICYWITAAFLGIACFRAFGGHGEKSLSRTALAVFAVTVTLTACFVAFLWSRPLSTDLGTFIYRYIEVGSGVSAALPLLFLVAAWVWWCWQSLTGLASTEEKNVVLPNARCFDQKIPDRSNPGQLDDAERLRLKAVSAEAYEPLSRTLGTLPFGEYLIILVFAAIGLGVILLLIRPREIAEAFESQTYKWMYWILLYSCLFLVCYLACQIVALWLEFRALLRAIQRLSFRRGFNDLKSLTWKPLWKLAGSGREEFVQLLGGEVDALAQIQNSHIPYGSFSDAVEDARAAANRVSAEFEKSGGRNDHKVWKLFQELQSKLSSVTAAALIYANRQWRMETYSPSFNSMALGSERPSVGPRATDTTLRAVEHFLCLFYLNIILVPLRRLQTLILAMAGVFVFVMISYGSYPFESRESFHAFLICIFFGISIVVGIVYGQMFADPLLSQITNTKPGELGLDFWVRLGTFVFIPLLSLLSVQFPAINSFLFSWLQPALQSVK
jgi:hypothetical protein